MAKSTKSRGHRIIALFPAKEASPSKKTIEGFLAQLLSDPQFREQISRAIERGIHQALRDVRERRRTGIEKPENLIRAKFR